MFSQTFEVIKKVYNTPRKCLYILFVRDLCLVVEPEDSVFVVCSQKTSVILCFMIVFSVTFLAGQYTQD